MSLTVTYLRACHQGMKIGGRDSFGIKELILELRNVAKLETPQIKTLNARKGETWKKIWVLHPGSLKIIYPMWEARNIIWVSRCYESRANLSKASHSGKKLPQTT
ncbi:hypothetical protein NPIL_243671 [Nephila pilipes]|uniref:Uncharacterized protein n=1 Tax=Nephila pilipes TaxID=299642 RepID=A0A8X6QBA9_NEPPI|nr:hypothetical protein NPIL_243671 [Nephila pilipes]